MELDLNIDVSAHDSCKNAKMQKKEKKKIANFLAIPVRLSIFVDTNSSGKSKIRQLQNSLFGDQHIGSFHISMNNFVTVNVIKSVQQLLHHFFDFSQ